MLVVLVVLTTAVLPTGDNYHLFVIGGLALYFSILHLIHCFKDQRF